MRRITIILLLTGLLWLHGCSGPSSASDSAFETKTEALVGSEHEVETVSEPQTALVYERSMELQYAKQFTADYYTNGVVMVSVADGRKYCIVPEDAKPPQDLETDIIILQRPLENIYLVASAVMDMFCELDALESIRFSGQKAEGWSIPKAQEAMEQGTILYAGKYSMPDYELIVSEGCSLAIENNMILHSPEVIEKLEDFGIPTLIDQSSHESHPLGRVEWIKLYGVLLGKEEEAKAAFEKQVQSMERAAADIPSEKTVAFFYITTNGMVNVRASSDYVPKMIQLAGGRYIFEDLGDSDSSRSTVTMQMEEFYQTAKDADYLIYNSTIDGEIESVDALLQKEALLKDFKAVQNGNVWCTTRDMYQQSMSIGQMIEDIHSMLSDNASARENMAYLYPLE
ncbi:MAG: ABC transporter substrate-binding protein [Lachnospiraceae bacterium]|nr:ABC transporter substrate-binding protein [Lachnospiraceae bacterium]